MTTQKKNKGTAAGASSKQQALAAPRSSFIVRNPMLCLVVAVAALYIPTFFFGFTDLDDGIFINSFTDYNQDLGNVVTSFRRSILNTPADIYYRPVTLNSILLNYQLCGANIMGYHVVNVILHLIAVLLLYKLFRRLKANTMAACVAAIIFAVHPALTEAVAWVPGRIDILLAIFTFSFFIFSIDYTETGNVSSLALSILLLLLALFTKESAVFDPPAAVVLLALVLHRKWNERHNLIQYGLWASCLLIWLAARLALHIPFATIPTGELVKETLRKLPVIVQYFGKILLPVNLSVYPNQRDTSYLPGVLAIIIALVGITFAMAKKKAEADWGATIGGLLIFLLFVIPSLLVPGNISSETYEYRLYLPLVGILLVLQRIFMSREESAAPAVAGGLVAAGVLAMINFGYQKSFADPVTFWRQAVNTSPHSAHAAMMLAARAGDPVTTDSLFLRAFRLDPNEKYLNYIYAVKLQSEDSVLASEKYLLREKALTGYQECDFLLAHVALERKDFPGAISYLKDYLKNVPENQMANDNLLLLYLDSDQDTLAKEQARTMLSRGLKVDKAVLKGYGLEK